ncbi:3-keto-disaccharide hydrolase [Autumnicola psychrophila]|uniref:DUF1080 domain-containing protein n=1 Tax=Autumnicola psychrophila TaxID=3075592 RepID=A0ABU3DTA4_9FLAO|nr:DUF1080 domain-containing protein [Zunongwangia sp. F225]MDT0686943.1 DUF1080 domain-containing protein [Zunongwangia sp. F225]
MAVPFSFGQSRKISLQDLSEFKNPGKNWQIADDIYVDLDKSNKFRIEEGKGILVNEPKGRNNQDLYTEQEYGSIDLEFDYMMAPGSNSGIYLMGRYEVQLKDSWGSKNLTSAENGGVYERWDEKRPEGQKGYQGYAPRQNVSKAPGLWQNLKISFQAPQFDEKGNKTENAKLLKVELNGITIHENVELFGPTRGAVSMDEAPNGPLRIQGDHGAVAFRNFEVTSYDKPRPELSNLQVQVYGGRFNEVPTGLDSLPPEFEGKAVLLTSDLNTKSNQFLIRYTGDLEVKESGMYAFNLDTPGGTGLVRINNNAVVPFNARSGRGTVELSKGVVPIELLYSKYEDWVEPGLGMTVEGPGIREYLVTEGGGNYETVVNPILVEVNENTILRSFMDIPVSEESGGYRVTHSVNVGSPEQLHYTYDMNKGSLVQVWRGDFLDATPMWYSRGDGSSRPLGAVKHFGIPTLTLAKLNSPNQKWIKDTIGTQYRPLGYHLDDQNRPVFMYNTYGAEVTDAVQVLENGHGFQRTIQVQNPGPNLYARIARGSKIESVSKDLFIVDDKEYYLRLDNPDGTKPVLRTVEGQQELLMPLQEKLIYSILY